MRAVVQRVRRARVTVGDRAVADIGAGAVVLLGVARGDTPSDAARLAAKVSALRIFDGADGRLDEPIPARDASFLVVSQFTLYGDCRRGNRPSYVRAAPPGEAGPLYEAFVAALRGRGHDVATGAFGEHMVVALENDGPVTVLLETASGAVSEPLA